MTEKNEQKVVGYHRRMTNDSGFQSAWEFVGLEVNREDRIGRWTCEYRPLVYGDTTPPLDALRALEQKWREDVERGTGYLNDESDRAVLSCADDLAATIKAMGGGNG